MPKPVFYKLLLRSTYITVGLFLLWLGLDAILSGTVWAGMKVSKSALTVEYCEFNQVNRFFHQPINTYSNLAYVFLGILISLLALEDSRNHDAPRLNRLERFPLLSAFTGLCFIYLGFGSAFFHASLTYAGQRMDMNGTYAVMIALIGLALYHVLHGIQLTSVGKTLWVLVLLGIIGAFLQLWLLIPSSRLLPALILSLTALMVLNYFQFRRERSILFVILSFALTIIALKIRTLDVQKVNCNPHSLIQGHAFWHIMTALSSFCSYSFFRFTGVINKKT